MSLQVSRRWRLPTLISRVGLSWRFPSAPSHPESNVRIEMKTTQASRALTLLGVSLIAGAAVASEPARLDPTTVRTLAEAKRSLERMPVSRSSAAAAVATSKPRSLAEVKRDLNAPAGPAAASGDVPLSGRSLAEAKRLD